MLPESGPIALRAISDSEKNVGVHEQGGNNMGQYVEIYQRSVGDGPGSPWCAAYGSYRIRHAAVELEMTSNIPKDFPCSGWCPDYKDWAMQHGVWIPCANLNELSSIVHRGDICLFYFAAKQRVAHFGQIAEVRDWGCYTVEGNTGPEGGQEVKRDGDGVYRKTRNWEEFGGIKAGFVRLSF